MIGKFPLQMAKILFYSIFLSLLQNYMIKYFIKDSLNSLHLKLEF